MSKKLIEISSKRNKLIADAQVLINEGRAATPEYRQMIKDIDEHTETLGMLERLERNLPNLPLPAPVVPVLTPESREQRRAKLNESFRAYLRGTLDQRIPEHRALVTSTDVGGGAVVPVEFSGVLSEALKLWAPLTGYANTIIGTRSVKVSTVDDTANGLTLITEGTALAETDPTFASFLVDRDILSAGIVKFAKELLSDSSFDLEQVLKNLISSRIGRGAERAITLGKDVTGTTLPNNPGLINIAQIATTSGTIAAGLGWGDLTSTFDALDPAYLPRAVWLMSSKTRNYLAALKDSTGRSFFVPGTQNSLDMLLGRPIVINQSLPSPTAGVFSAGDKPIIFGSLYDGLQIVTSDLRVQTLHERFADVNLSALTAYTRIGSASLQAGAIQALRIAAS